MIRLGVIAIFWVITAVACCRPTPRMRSMFLSTFFSLLISCGLSHSPLWPFFPWDMWDDVEPAFMDWREVSLVDATSREWRYDFSAIPPACPAIIERKCGMILLDSDDRATSLAAWLLRRARTLRDSPMDIRPQWWSTDLGFLPVGPAARESCRGWSSDTSSWPSEFVEIVVRRKRVHFSTRFVAAREETLEEKRFQWNGL